jgi:hypothetical protein
MSRDEKAFSAGGNLIMLAEQATRNGCRATAVERIERQPKQSKESGTPALEYGHHLWQIANLRV